jgi:hypothetical protein
MIVFLKTKKLYKPGIKLVWSNLFVQIYSVRIEKSSMYACQLPAGRRHDKAVQAGTSLGKCSWVCVPAGGGGAAVWVCDRTVRQNFGRPVGPLWEQPRVVSTWRRGVRTGLFSSCEWCSGDAFIEESDEDAGGAIGLNTVSIGR